MNKDFCFSNYPEDLICESFTIGYERVSAEELLMNAINDELSKEINN